MASLYKKPVRGKDPETGKLVKTDSKKWWGRYRDELGQDKRVPLTTDRRAAQKMLDRIVGKVDRIKIGLVDPTEQEMQRPIKEHIKEYEKHLKAKNNAPRYVKEAVYKIEKASRFCRWRTAAQIKAVGVEHFLTDLREERKRSTSTSNHYLRALKSFINWLVANEKLQRNPLVSLKMLNTNTDRRHDRRPLSQEEFSLLLDVAQSGPPVQGISGPDRAMLYVLAAWTGLRRGEISSLTTGSFDLDSQVPTVTVEAGYSKHRRKDVQVLHAELVKHLRHWLTEREPGPGELLFPLSLETCGIDRRTSKMMKYDLSAARTFWLTEASNETELSKREATDFLKYKNSKGLFADFHSLRHTFITNLCKADVPPKTAQTLARHSDISLTMNIYTHVDQAEQVKAIGALPGPQSTTALRS